VRFTFGFLTYIDRPKRNYETFRVENFCKAPTILDQNRLFLDGYRENILERIYFSKMFINSRNLIRNFFATLNSFGNLFITHKYISESY
jgi:hypothetical protein